MKDPRLEHEILHGRRIRGRAEEIWGWASPAGRIRAERRARYFIEWTGMRSDHRVLEIGCGSGLFTEKVSRSGAAITATDLSEDLLDLARNRRLPRCQVERADAHALPYAEGAYDIVFGSSILHHLDLDRALPEMRRVLKPGGQLMFAEPNMMNPQIFIQKNIHSIKRWMGDTPDETAFFRWSLSRALRDHGFTNPIVEPYDFLHPATPRPLLALVEPVAQFLERVPILKEIAGSLLIHARKG